MKRKMTITITGDDGDDRVSVSLKFDPCIEDDIPPSGFSSTASRYLEFYLGLVKESEADQPASSGQPEQEKTPGT